MKKVLSIILALVLLCSFSFSAMALKSQEGTEYHKVIINQTHTGSNSEKADEKIVAAGSAVVVKPVAPKAENVVFEAISIFTDITAKVAAKLDVDFKLRSVKFNATGAVAVEGVDYKIDKENGKIISLKGDILTIEVEPLADHIFISDVFKDAEGKVLVEDIKFNGVKAPEFSPTLPLNGDTYNSTILAVLCLMIISAGFVAFASKRSFN